MVPHVELTASVFDIYPTPNYVISRPLDLSPSEETLHRLDNPLRFGSLHKPKNRCLTLNLSDLYIGGPLAYY